MEAARPALEHGTSRTGRWLRTKRLQVALWIAVAEFLLLVLGAVPLLPVLGLALLLILFHLVVGRRLAWDTGRQASRVAATSQVFAAFVPAVLLVAGALALAALLAAVAVTVIVLLARVR